MDVNGKVAVVTGAASGIGFALSKALMAAGAKGVAMADLQADALQAHAATIGRPHRCDRRSGDLGAL